MRCSSVAQVDAMKVAVRSAAAGEIEAAFRRRLDGK
jgi:hypothetical protein